MHEETPEETAEKFAKRISDLIDEERLAFEEAASAHDKGAVNGGVTSCQWGGAKVGHLVARLGA